jgi:hypothetical protein
MTGGKPVVDEFSSISTGFASLGKNILKPFLLGSVDHPTRIARGKLFGAIADPFPIDDGLCSINLPKWVPDPSLRKKILVDDPARLYGFEAV